MIMKAFTPTILKNLVLKYLMIKIIIYTHVLCALWLLWVITAPMVLIVGKKHIYLGSAYGTQAKKVGAITNPRQTNPRQTNPRHDKP